MFCDASSKLNQENRGGEEGKKKDNEGVHASFIQLSPFIGVFAPRREPNLENRPLALLECVLPDLDRNDQAGETGRDMSRGLASRCSLRPLFCLDCFSCGWSCWTGCGGDWNAACTGG